jgi:hypothetical protein
VTRWPDLLVLGSAELPALHGGADRILWPGLITLAQQLPVEHVVIGGVMVYLHGAVKNRRRSESPRMSMSCSTLK